MKKETAQTKIEIVLNEYCVRNNIEISAVEIKIDHCTTYSSIYGNTVGFIGTVNIITNEKTQTTEGK